MKVAVTGGTGFVGREIVKQLYAAGHLTRVLVRDPGSSTAMHVANSFNAGLCPGTLHNATSLNRLCAGCDAVIHLVGIISEIGDNTFEHVHVRGTENVLAAAKQNGVPRVIHMSALGTRPDAVSPYHKSKWFGEEAVRGSGLNATIFRPSIIYGRHDSFTNLFARISARSPFLPVMGSGKGTFQPIWVKNVAQFFVAALNEPRAIGQTIDLVGPEVMTLNELLDQLMRALGRRRMKLHIPVPLAWLMALFLEAVYPRIFKAAPPLNRGQITMLQEKTVGDGTLAGELFGIQPVRFREGLNYLSRTRGS